MAGPILTCSCGAKVRVPEGAAASFRCPRCKAAIAIPGQEPPAVAPQAWMPAAPDLGAAAITPPTPPVVAPPAPPVVSAPLHADRETICPICQTGILQGEDIHTCAGCDQIHHSECWREIGGCGTFGCKEAPATEKDAEDVQAPLTAWGDTKKCPACGEVIKSIAVRCRYCGTSFDSVDPMSAADLRRHAIASEELKSFKTGVAVLFGVTLIAGCLAPLMLIISLVYLLPRREKLAKCGPLFTILGWTTIGLSVAYSLLMLMFFLLGE
jgi:hypothetical protein